MNKQKRSRHRYGEHFDGSQMGEGLKAQVK